MTLFDDRRKAILNRQAPLATRMRPRNLDEFVGQQKLVGPGRVVRRMIERDRLHSMILWGPPGSGKTTLAQLISGVTKSFFAEMSAVTSGVRDIRSEAADAQHRIGSTGTRTILFVDEIHRFSKSQQDALLPHVEAGTFILIGATTENPSFEVNAPLLSRTRVYTIEPLEDADMNRIIDAALEDLERGLASTNPTLDDEARSFLLRASNGDARSALNALEVAVDSAAEEDGTRTITVELVEQAIEKRSRYDRLGDMHYDTISAFIKSIRASDPDAAVYYLARMIDAGEDPLFIARRLVISAAEDIGLANPNGLAVAVAAQQAVSFVGMPEGRIPLAEATIFLASAPKSNSAYLAIDKALGQVRANRDEPVPMHLRNAPTGLMRRIGYGKGYEYPHDAPGHFVPAENLPENVQGERFYEPGELGAERQIAERLRGWWGEGTTKDE
ncbi:MAG: replication-associated recombination protein A [Chloroflexi bacterium]|nr:replication-associated recombination protein A [Chloroflexota bacterium]